MEETLNKISELIERYESGTWQSVANLRIILRELSTYNYRLTKFNIEYFQDHNAVQYKHKGTVSAGLILANEQVPELRMTRKILFATSKVIDAVRSEIAILRTEN